MFNRVKNLLRRNQYIDTISPAFLNKAKSNTENSFVCVVTEVDTTYDTITVYSFHHDSEITFPMSYEYSINVNDVILVVNIDGIYHILGKANINYQIDERYVYDPDSMDKKEILKTQKVNINSLPKVDYLSKFYIKKEIGEIVKNIKLTGYKIKEEAIYLFSGITRFVATFSLLQGVSKKIKFQLFNNKSFIELNENNDGTSSYNISLFYKNGVPYFLEIKGDVLDGLNQNKIILQKMPFDINEKSVYIKVIFTKQDSDINLNKKNKISHQYINRKNTFSENVEIGNGISEHMIDKIGSYIKEDTLLGDEPLIIFNENDKYVCRIIEMETIDGAILKYCNNENSFHKNYKFDYSNTNIQASDFNNIYWASSYEEYNYPYASNSFKITKTYANEEKNNYSLLYHKKWTYFINKELNTTHTQEICKDCNISSMRTEEIPYLQGKYSYHQHIFQKLDNSKTNIGKSITINEDTNQISYITDTTSPFAIYAKIGEKKFQVLVNADMLYFSGFKNAIFQNVKNIVATDSILNLNKLYVLNDSIFKGTFYISNNSNIILKSKNFYINADTSMLKSENVVLYGTKSAAIYSSDDINSGGIFINPSVVSINAEQISIPGYCLCS